MGRIAASCVCAADGKIEFSVRLWSLSYISGKTFHAFLSASLGVESVRSNVDVELTMCWVEVSGMSGSIIENTQIVFFCESLNVFPDVNIITYTFPPRSSLVAYGARWEVNLSSPRLLDPHP